MKKFTDRFINDNLFVFDTFENCIIRADKKSEYAPPERYFEISARKDDLDIYMDTYWINRADKSVIDFAYTYKNSWEVDSKFWYESLYAHFEHHGLKRQEYELKSRIYPRKKFKRLLEEYYE